LKYLNIRDGFVNPSDPAQLAAYTAKLKDAYSARAVALGAMNDAQHELLTTQQAAAQAAQVGADKAGSEAVSAVESGTVMGGSGLIAKATEGWKKFAPNVWNKFKNGVMDIGGIFPRLLAVLQKNGLNNNTVGFGIALGLVK